MIDEDVDYKLFGVIVVFRDGSRLAFEVGQDVMPQTLVVECLGGISPQDFLFEAEYLFFHSLPSWAGGPCFPVV
jgi:hypothetical protein